jgi:hypothetical protein
MSPISMGRLELGLRIVLEFTEAYNRRDSAAMSRLVSDSCVLQTAAGGPEGERRGREELARYWEEGFRGSAPRPLEVEEIFGVGLRCVLRWRQGAPEAGGREGQRRGVTLFKVNGGLIVEMLVYIKA